MSNNLTIKLKSKKDKDGATYYVGKLKFPGNLNCEDGVVFLIFTADKDEEQLQIASMDKKENKQQETDD